MEYSELIQEAIKKAHENDAKNIITIEHESGANTTERFYKKNNAIWCEMITGCIKTNSRVYKVNTEKPYIRDLGSYWYLGEREKAIIANM